MPQVVNGGTNEIAMATPTTTPVKPVDTNVTPPGETSEKSDEQVNQAGRGAGENFAAQREVTGCGADQQTRSQDENSSYDFR